MKIRIFHHDYSYRESETNIRDIAILDIKLHGNDITLFCKFIDNYVHIRPSSNYVSIGVSCIPERIDYESKFDNLHILNAEECEYHTEPYSLLGKPEHSITLWKRNEREEATEIETGDLSAISC